MKIRNHIGRLLGVFCAAAMITAEAQAQSNVVTYPTAGEMATYHMVHRMLPLPDGRLLLQGDVIPPSVGTNTVEVYNPESRTFQRVGQQLALRWQDTSAILHDGRLLIVGGRTNSPNSDVVGTAELLDPVSGLTTPTGSLNIPRTTARAITLQDGRVLIIGGTPFGPNGTSLASELYDPEIELFTLCGGLIINRPASAVSATVLQDGRVLVAGGSTPIGENAELFDPETETFQLTGAMVARRYNHTATLLPDGRVVFIGGLSTFAPAPPVLTNLVEVFDPVTETFSALGTINTPRRNHTATLLPDGKIVITGGWTNTIAAPTATSNVEVFDPATGASVDMGEMGAPRADHRAEAVSSGQVIITGGRNTTIALKTAEIFDPLLLLRPEDLYAFYQEYAFLTLENQQLWNLYNDATNVIWGLTVTNSNLQGELAYANDALTNLQAQLDALQPNPFRILPGYISPRLRLLTLTMSDDRVVMIHGINLDNPIARLVYVFDPRTETYSTAGIINDPRTGFTGNLLPDDRILVAGGTLQLTIGNPITNSTEIYSAASSNSVPGPSMNYARADAFSVNLSDGRILIMGGRNATTNFVAQSEIYEPSSNAFRLSGVMPGRIIQASVTRLLDGRVLLVGVNTNSTTPVAQMFDPVTETFSTVSGVLTARSGHQATLLSDGRVLISGGRTGSPSSVVSATEIFDPSTGTFTAGPDMLQGRINFSATALPDGTVLIAGGQTNTSSVYPATLAAELYNPSTGVFSAAGTMLTNQFNHAATLLRNGAVMFAGGSTGLPGMFVNRVQVYDPMHHIPTSEFGNLQLLVDDLQSENDDLNTQVANLQQQYINATNVIWGLSITNAQLQQELAMCQSNETFLEFQIVGLTNQIGQLQGTVATLTAQNNALTNQVAQQQVTINSLTGQVNSLTNQVAQQQAIINALTAQNNALTNQVAQQAALIASLHVQNSALTNQVATLTQENQQLQTTIANVDAQVTVLETAFQNAFGDPAFVVPGATLEEQIQNLIAAILNLNHGQRQALYRELE